MTSPLPKSFGRQTSPRRGAAAVLLPLVLLATTTAIGAHCTVTDEPHYTVDIEVGSLDSRGNFGEGTRQTLHVPAVGDGDHKCFLGYHQQKWMCVDNDDKAPTPKRGIAIVMPKESNIGHLDHYFRIRPSNSPAVIFPVKGYGIKKGFRKPVIIYSKGSRKAVRITTKNSRVELAAGDDNSDDNSKSIEPETPVKRGKPKTTRTKSVVKSVMGKQAAEGLFIAPTPKVEAISQKSMITDLSAQYSAGWFKVPLVWPPRNINEIDVLSLEMEDDKTWELTKPQRTLAEAGDEGVAVVVRKLFKGSLVHLTSEMKVQLQRFGGKDSATDLEGVMAVIVAGEGVTVEEFAGNPKFIRQRKDGGRAKLTLMANTSKLTSDTTLAAAPKKILEYLGKANPEQAAAAAKCYNGEKRTVHNARPDSAADDTCRAVEMFEISEAYKVQFLDRHADLKEVTKFL